jgi:hypothetical protein
VTVDVVILTRDKKPRVLLVSASMSLSPARALPGGFVYLEETSKRPSAGNFSRRPAFGPENFTNSPPSVIFQESAMRLYAFLGVLLLVASGCAEPKVAPVSGRVTLDEKPLANATVLFLPVSQGSNPEAGSSGKTDGLGHYVLQLITKNVKGAFVGNHKVSITAYAGKKMSSNGSDALSRKGQVPAKYNTATELTFAVSPEGTASADFHLKSEP